MDHFKPYYLGLSPDARQRLAENVGTTTGYLHQIAYAGKSIELGLADALVANCDGAFTLDGLRLTERAQFQRIARQAPQKVEVA